MANQQNNKTPSLRFQGYREEWSFKIIHELISEGALYPPQDGNHGEIHPKKSDFVKRGIPFIMANNIRDGEVDYRNCSHITKSQAEKLQKGFSKSGDVLLTHKGTVGEIAIVRQCGFPFIMLTPQVTYYRISDCNKLDAPFLAFSFATSNFQQAIKKESGGGTRAYIGITQQQTLGITVPVEISEQTKIGTYFKNLDRMIELHQRKHNKLVTLKQAMLKKMFPQEGAAVPEIRFKGFSGDWKKGNLGAAGEFNPRASLPEIFEYVDLESVVGTQMVGHRTEFKKSAPSRAQRLAKQGDLFFQTVRPYQKNNHLFTLPNQDYVFSTGYAQIRPVNSGDFLLALMQRDHFVKIVLNNCTGTSYPAINSNVLANILVYFPSPEEQQKIGTYFRKLDDLITQHATQLEKLKQIKSACLEKMFV